MSDLRVSQIVVQLVLLDEFDAIRQTNPPTVTFAGDAEGTAAEKLAAWLEALPTMIAEAKPA